MGKFLSNLVKNQLNTQYSILITKNIFLMIALLTTDLFSVKQN